MSQLVSFSGKTGSSHVRPASADRFTATALGQSRWPNENVMAHAYASWFGPKIAVTSDPRSNDPPTAFVRPGRFPLVHVAPPSCDVANPGSTEPPVLNRP